MADDEVAPAIASPQSEEGDVKACPDAIFSPPLYRQRYSAVIDVIEKEGAKKVADLGCAECKLIPLLRRMHPLEEVAGVDIDRRLLEEKKYLIRPLPAEYLCQRDHPFRIRLYEGDIAKYDSRLCGFDCITMIEVVEHLYDDVLSEFPAVVFGEIKPRLVIMTTPNSEYNVLFPGFTGMRHWDHKFEWTRQEFENWCNNICSNYGYCVEFSGVGAPPPDREDVGFCSQIAVFKRQPTDEDEIQDSATEEYCQSQPYSMVAEEVFPYRIKPPKDVALPQEIQYYTRKIIIMERDSRNRICEDSEDLYEDDSSVLVVKLEEILVYKGIKENCCGVQELRESLKSLGYTLTEEEDAVVLNLDDDDEYSDEDSSSTLDDQYSHNGDDEENGLEDVEEETWDDVEDPRCTQASNVIPFEEMWADAETDVDHIHLCNKYMGRGKNDFIVNFDPEEHGIDPKMLYIPSVLHAAKMPSRIHCAECEEGQFTDDFQEGNCNGTEPKPKVNKDATSRREILKDFVVEVGQFDDVGDDTLDTDLEKLKICPKRTDNFGSETLKEAGDSGR